MTNPLPTHTWMTQALRIPSPCVLGLLGHVRPQAHVATELVV